MSQADSPRFFIQTNECDLDLRLQHFHSFSKHGEGGHYHNDTTPDTVEYEGYFNVGHRIVRIDKPIVIEISPSLILSNSPNCFPHFQATQSKIRKTENKKATHFLCCRIK
jgi:hypothetical protein